MASSLEELARHFEDKTARMKRCLELRGISSSDEAVETLRCINNEVTEIEEILSEFKGYLSEQKELLHKAKSLDEVFTSFRKRTKHIASNLPPHLPGRKSIEPGNVLQQRNQETAVGAPTEKKGKPKAKSGRKVSYHKIEYLTMDEFKNVPKYLKGRLTYSQVNSAIDQIHSVLAAKYKILGTPRTAMSELVMRKYRDFKDQETPETKGCSFFVDKDLKEYSTFKLDKTGQFILSILRHCGKLKEVRGGKLVRFVVLA